MSKRLKRISACLLCLILVAAAVWGYYMIRRGPEIAIFHDYGVHFRDWPFVVSRKMHLDLGEAHELEEENETKYKVETNLFGVGSTLFFSFFGGRQLSEVSINMPMDDPAEIRERFQEFVAMIESAYEGKAEFSKDDIVYTDEHEYKIDMSFRDSGATGVYYRIKATDQGLTISCSYIF